MCPSPNLRQFVLWCVVIWSCCATPVWGIHAPDAEGIWRLRLSSELELLIYAKMLQTMGAQALEQWHADGHRRNCYVRLGGILVSLEVV